MFERQWRTWRTSRHGTQSRHSEPQAGPQEGATGSSGNPPPVSQALLSVRQTSWPQAPALSGVGLERSQPPACATLTSSKERGAQSATGGSVSLEEEEEEGERRRRKRSPCGRKEGAGERAAGANGSKASLGPSISWHFLAARSVFLSVPGGSSPTRGRSAHPAKSRLKGQAPALPETLQRGGGIKDSCVFPGGGPVWQGGPAANLSSLPVPVPGPALERQ